MKFTDKELENLYRAVKILENGEGLLGMDIDKVIVGVLVLKLKKCLSKNTISHINKEIEMLIYEAKMAMEENSAFMPEYGFDREFDPSYPTMETTKVLNKAIKNGDCVEIVYYSLNQAKFTQRKIEPKIIEKRNGKAYLNAFCHLRNEERVFRIDRIKKIKKCD